jgi:hypothetical protein
VRGGAGASSAVSLTTGRVLVESADFRDLVQTGKKNPRSAESRVFSKPRGPWLFSSLTPATKLSIEGKDTLLSSQSFQNLDKRLFGFIKPV